MVNHGEVPSLHHGNPWKSPKNLEEHRGCAHYLHYSPTSGGSVFKTARRWWFQWRFWIGCWETLGNHQCWEILGHWNCMKLSCHWYFSMSLICWDILDGMMIMFGKHWICHWFLERFGWLQLTKWLVTSRARTGRVEVSKRRGSQKDRKIWHEI